MNNNYTGYPQPPREYADEKEHRKLIANSVNLAMQGKLNATGEITLREKFNSTELLDPRLSIYSYVELMPLTADAAYAKISIYFTDQASGTVTIRHDASISTTQSFRYLIIG